MPKRLLAVALALCLLLNALPALALENNTLVATVDGVETTFYLEYAKLGLFDLMAISYISYDPRGDKDQRITLSMNQDIAPGTYETGDEQIRILIYTYDESAITAVENADKWSHEYKASMTGNGSFALRLDERSADWTSYSGVFTAVLEGQAPETGYRKIENARFQFTLNEQHPGPGKPSDIPTVTADDLLPAEEPAGNEDAERLSEIFSSFFNQE